MGASARKDNVTANTLSKSNETYKRIMFQNTPFSVEATGADKLDKVLVLKDEASFDNIYPRQKVLLGNKVAYVKTVTKSESDVIESIDIEYIDSDGDAITRTYTMDEIIDSTELFIIDDLY